MGARRLRTWLAFPLQDPRASAAPRRRRRAGGATPSCAQALRESLGDIPDLERIAVRATLGAATPRDLGPCATASAACPTLIAPLARQEDAADALGPCAMDPCAPTSRCSQGSLADAPRGARRRRGVSRGLRPRARPLHGLATNGAR
jgi:DNA mismatch repair protein MutS